MLVNWNYKERDTIVQKLDPRARVLFILCAIVAITLVWDLRLLAIWLVFALGVLRLAKLTWQETRRFWLVVIPVVTAMVLLTALTGRGGEEAYQEQTIVWQARWSLGGWSPSFSSQQLVFALCQFARMISMAALSLIIPFTIHPAQYGITFKGLGLSDKFAAATDLAFRFVPPWAGISRPCWMPSAHAATRWSGWAEGWRSRCGGWRPWSSLSPLAPSWGPKTSSMPWICAPLARRSAPG